MTVRVRTLSYFSDTTSVETETLKLLAAFSLSGLVASLFFAAYGLDLSPGFF